jgi:predicted dehydrogenase
LRRVIVGPQMPYFKGGYPMEAPGVGIGNQEQFNYQARAFLDQIAGVADPLPPNATFADGLRSMEIIQAVVQSSQSDGAAVAIAPSGSGTAAAATGTATVPAPPA